MSFGSCSLGDEQYVLRMFKGRGKRDVEETFGVQSNPDNKVRSTDLCVAAGRHPMSPKRQERFPCGDLFRGCDNLFRRYGTRKPLPNRLTGAYCRLSGPETWIKHSNLRLGAPELSSDDFGIIHPAVRTVTLSVCLCLCSALKPIGQQAHLP